MAFPLLYVDPLRALAAWRGTDVGWTVGTTGALVLVISALAAQLEAIDGPISSARSCCGR